MFAENLHKVLQEIYLLVTKAKYSAEYIENIAPSERDLIIFYYNKEQKEKEKNTKGMNGPNLFDEDNILSDMM